MKAYNFTASKEHYWVCASSIFQARRVFKNHTGLTMDEIDNIVIDEIKESEWENLFIIYDRDRCSLRQYMETAIAPCIIASLPTTLWNE